VIKVLIDQFPPCNACRLVNLYPAYIPPRKRRGKGKEEDEEINLWGNLKITTRTFLGLGQRWLR